MRKDAVSPDVYERHKARERARHYRLRESPVYQRNHKSEHLARRYGMTISQKEALIARQGGRCALCSTDNPGGIQGWHIDHDHQTGEVRGILCRGCNHAIGHYERLKKSVGLDAVERYLAGMPKTEEALEPCL